MIKIAVFLGLTLVILAIAGLIYLDRAAQRRDKRRERKEEQEHEERMELFDDEDL